MQDMTARKFPIPRSPLEALAYETSQQVAGGPVEYIKAKGKTKAHESFLSFGPPSPHPSEGSSGSAGRKEELNDRVTDKSYLAYDEGSDEEAYQTTGPIPRLLIRT